ncbi:MAG: zeta toxin family protein [Polaromonas sp.]|nr:zeta toxin family protein [Polaromonas sp.]
MKGSAPSVDAVFYLLAGPNGAGKSTLYRSAVADGLIPQDAEFVNADVYEAGRLQHVADAQARSEQARQWADARRATLLQLGQSFVSETVFSHPSKLLLIEDAQRSGFAVVLLIVCLDDARRLLQRVAQRVQEGGHAVPANRILARYPRTLDNLAKAVRVADMALLFDTGGASKSGVNLPVQVAVCRRGNTRLMVDKPPAWARLVLG